MCKLQQVVVASPGPARASHFELEFLKNRARSSSDADTSTIEATHARHARPGPTPPALPPSSP